MNCSEIPFWCCLWLILLQCSPSQNENQVETIALEQLTAFPISTKKTKKKKRTGKLKNAEFLPLTYNKANLSNFTLPYIDPNLTSALKQQLKLLKRRKQNYSQNFKNLSLNLSDLETTIELLLLWQQTYPQGLTAHLNAYQLKGRDGRGNVKFTGYFTPELKVSKRNTNKYKYPIYAYPKKWEGPLPTRQEIDGEGVLNGKGLELAFSERLEDIYYMQLQGSGLVRFPNGKGSYFGYSGSNRHPYSSIGRFISGNSDIRLKNISMDGIKSFMKYNPEQIKPILFTNPSYVFFKASKSLPLGAGHVPLTADYSMAVDTRHLPLGSCLLAAVPILDETGIFSHHEYRFLLAQDVGGAIKGNGHVDVYCGIGEIGKQKAMALHHYGQLWLLLPKPSNEIGPIFSEGSWVEN